jgi:hypothetical protein
VLTGVANTVGASQPHRVIETSVDRLGVVASRIEGGEVGIRGRDRSDVLGPVQLADDIFGIVVEPDSDRAAAVTLREAVVVVPAKEPAPVSDAMGSHPRQGE